MFGKWIYDLLFKALEFVLTGFFGFGIYFILLKIFSLFWAVLGLIWILWFFSPMIKPYLDCLREYLYEKIICLIKWIIKKIKRKDEKNN